MHDLMIHVERIVRPVRANQSRKLRMRRELLAHLQLALEEERGRSADEATAIERAKGRLGDPSELTRQLQRSVPWMQRLLLGRVPLPQRVDQWEAESAARIYGRSVLTMTLSHISILMAIVGLLAGIPCYFPEPVRRTLTGGGNALAHPGLFFLGILVALNVGLIVSMRFVTGLSNAVKSFNLRRTLGGAAVFVALQIGWMYFAIGAAANRLATPTEVTGAIGVTMSLVAIAILAARYVRVLRRRYDEWLSLDLSESSSA